MIRAVIFDLDDTLYPEIDFVYGGYRAVAGAVKQDHGVDIYADLVGLFESGRRGDLFTPALQLHLQTVDESYVQGLVKVYRSHRCMLKPFPDVPANLKALQSTHALAIVSDGILEVQRCKVAALDELTGYFRQIIFSDQWGRDYWKPHPRPFEECLRALALRPQEAIYVADNPHKDFLGPRRLGMPSVRIRRPGTLHCGVRLSASHEADYEVESLSQLEETISWDEGSSERT